MAAIALYLIEYGVYQRTSTQKPRRFDLLLLLPLTNPLFVFHQTFRRLIWLKHRTCLHLTSYTGPNRPPTKTLRSILCWSSAWRRPTRRAPICTAWIAIRTVQIGALRVDRKSTRLNSSH